jgi:hypothetical protein
MPKNNPKNTKAGIMFVYVSNNDGAITVIFQCDLLMFVYPCPNVVVGIGVIGNVVNDISFPHPVESHAVA